MEVKAKEKRRGEAAPSILEEREPPTKETFGTKMSNLFKSKTKEKAEEPAAKPPTKTSGFFNVGTRVKKAMTNLFKDGKSMKWDHFVKVR